MPSMAFCRSETEVRPKQRSRRGLAIHPSVSTVDRETMLGMEGCEHVCLTGGRFWPGASWRAGCGFAGLPSTGESGRRAPGMGSVWGDSGLRGRASSDMSNSSWAGQVRSEDQRKGAYIGAHSTRILCVSPGGRSKCRETTGDWLGNGEPGLASRQN